MDKKSHKYLTILLYVVFATGYIVIILGNEGGVILPLFIYTLIVVLHTYSHIKYYRHNAVDSKGKTFIIVNMLLMFIFLFFDNSPLEQYFLLILIGDCIFAFSLAFSFTYIIATYFAFYPYMIMIYNFRGGAYTFLDSLEDLVISIFCIAIIFMTKFQIMINVKYDALLVKSNEAYKKLKKYSTKVEELAVVEERNRIALILHNSIGHSLTSIMLSLQAEKVELVSKNKINNKAFANVEQLIQEAMGLLRKTIENADDFMKDMPFDDLMDMFIRNAANNTKVNISYQANKTYYIKDEQRNVIFNLVIESITNAMKHSGCEQIIVTINGHKDRIRIDIKDDGCGFDTIDYGYGITKMKEQVEEIGGSYKISSNVGCQVIVVLPINEVNADV